MTLENIKIETETRYGSRDEEDNYINKSYDVLVFKVPIPGGVAQYELKIDSDFRKSLEKAVSLK